MPVSIRGTAGGSVTLSSGAAATDTTLTLPNTTGTVALTASPTFSGTLTATTITSPASTALTIQSAGTTAMTIDTSQNVGIGTTSPGAKLQVSGSVYIGANNYFTDTLGGYFAFGNGTFTTGWYSQSDGAMAFRANGSSERMRLDSSGNLLVGQTATFSSNKMVVAAANDGQLALNATTAGSSVYTTLSFANQGTVKTQAYWESTQSRFYIANSGGGVYLTTAATAWTAASDERVKNIIEPITDAAAKVNQLRAVIGSYKSDETNKRKSFLIAQDVLAVLPEAVDTSNPDEFGLAYTDVIPLLVAACQELSAKNDALEARLAALEVK